MTDTVTAALGEPPRRIAVVRALQLGDVLVVTPALRALRVAFPSAQITFVGLPWARQFAERMRHLLDDFLEFPGFPNLPEREFDACGFPHFIEQARRTAFDVVIQLHGSGLVLNSIVAMLGARCTAGFYPKGHACPHPDLYLEYPPTGHEIRRNLALMSFLGVELQGEHLDFPLSAEDLAEAKAMCGKHKLKDYVCLHAGARYRTRRWPAERFAAVGDALAKGGFGIALTGSADEAELVAQVSRQMTRRHANLAGMTSLGGLAALLGGARLLITNDTGVSHVGTAVGVRSVVIVMGSAPERWAPLDTRQHIVVYEPIDCRPCSHDLCPIAHPCGTRVTVERVLDAAHHQLNLATIRRTKRPLSSLSRAGAYN